MSSAHHHREAADDGPQTELEYIRDTQLLKFTSPPAVSLLADGSSNTVHFGVARRTFKSFEVTPAGLRFQGLSRSSDPADRSERLSLVIPFQMASDFGFYSNDDDFAIVFSMVHPQIQKRIRRILSIHHESFPHAPDSDSSNQDVVIRLTRLQAQDEIVSRIADAYQAASGLEPIDYPSLKLDEFLDNRRNHSANDMVSEDVDGTVAPATDSQILPIESNEEPETGEITKNGKVERAEEVHSSLPIVKPDELSNTSKSTSPNGPTRSEDIVRQVTSTFDDDSHPIATKEVIWTVEDPKMTVYWGSHSIICRFLVFLNRGLAYGMHQAQDSPMILHFVPYKAMRKVYFWIDEDGRLRGIHLVSIAYPEQHLEAVTARLDQLRLDRDTWRMPITIILPDHFHLDGRRFLKFKHRIQKLSNTASVTKLPEDEFKALISESGTKSSNPEKTTTTRSHSRTKKERTFEVFEGPRSVWFGFDTSGRADKILTPVECIVQGSIRIHSRSITLEGLYRAADPRRITTTVNLYWGSMITSLRLCQEDGTGIPLGLFANQIHGWSKSHLSNDLSLIGIIKPTQILLPFPDGATDLSFVGLHTALLNTRPPLSSTMNIPQDRFSKLVSHARSTAVDFPPQPKTAHKPKSVNHHLNTHGNAPFHLSGPSQMTSNSLQPLIGHHGAPLEHCVPPAPHFNHHPTDWHEPGPHPANFQSYYPSRPLDQMPQMPPSLQSGQYATQLPPSTAASQYDNIYSYLGSSVSTYPWEPQ